MLKFLTSGPSLCNINQIIATAALRISEAEKNTHPRHLIIIDDFKILVCITHKIDVF